MFLFLQKTYVLNVFVKYNNFSLLQKLVVAANHPNCGTVRTVSRVAVFAGRDKETQVWKSKKNKICMIHKSGIENAKMLNCMLLFLYNPILFYWVFLGRQMSSGSKTDQIEKKNRPLKSRNFCNLCPKTWKKIFVEIKYLSQMFFSPFIYPFQ